MSGVPRMPTTPSVACSLLVAAFLASFEEARAASVEAAVAPGVRAAAVRPMPRSVSSGRSLDFLYPDAGVVETPALDIVSLAAEDAAGNFEALRMGIVQDVRVSSKTAGTWVTLDDGKLWTASFRALGASAVELCIAPWNPPPGAELIVFSAADPSYALGPFTNVYPHTLDAFWTPSLYTEEVRLEYFVPNTAISEARDVELTVTGVLNQYRPFRERRADRVLSCHLDANCYTFWWGSEADGVGALSYVWSRLGFFCSGGLLNRIPSDLTPLFMTAHHCVVNDPGDPNTNGWVTWFWESTFCNSGQGVDASTLPQTLVTSTIAEDPTERSPGVFGGTDIRLVGIAETVPGAATFLGWDSAAWPNGSDAIGIHHPDGSYKRISFGTKIDNDFCTGRTTYEVHYESRDGFGSLEPGSSGSPLFDTNHHVRGVTSCANWNCMGTTNVGYGEFSEAYPRALEAMLNPVDPVYVNGSYGGFERGTVGQPFNRFVEGTFAVIRGHGLFINAGSYPERFTITKAMTLNAVGGTVVIGP